VGETGVVPSVNQIEVHPFFRNDAACAASRRHGTAVEAWSPLAQGQLLHDDAVAEIATGHGKTAAQVVLRWHVQHGNIAIPKSMHRARMQENLEIFDFELSGYELARIDALGRGSDGRIGPDPNTFDWFPPLSVS
jgi:2,5-diketo-D-gluconate reductase A